MAVGAAESDVGGDEQIFTITVRSDLLVILLVHVDSVYGILCPVDEKRCLRVILRCFL